jgi:ABC-type cobalamin/Fe3+-siderophores transport system ATPase subunit
MGKFPEITEALSKPKGAEFFKCALQVNNFEYGSKFRGKPVIAEDAFNLRLAENCKSNGIQVVGIADHCNVNHIENSRQVLNREGIVVFPGFEIASTEKIHMVCLYDPNTTRDQLNRYLGDLGAIDCEDEVVPSRLGCLEIARKVIVDHGGIWYASHMTGNNGLLKLDGPGDNYKHIWLEENHVVAGQIPGPIIDLPSKYKEIVENKKNGYVRQRKIASINAMDLVLPEDLGSASVSCSIKMTHPTIDALKQAFLDPDSRVRLNSESLICPQANIIAAAWTGGFLNGVRINFSENLNTIIGGRGAGKSTIVETIRYCLGIKPKSKDAETIHQNIIENAMGNGGSVTLLIKSQKQMGRSFFVKRQFKGLPEVFDESEKLSSLTPFDVLPSIEIFGQNEILDMARIDSERLGLLNRFLPEDASEMALIRSTRKSLETNRIKLLDAKKDLDETSALVGQLPKLEEQAAGFNSLGLDKKLADAGKLNREATIFKTSRENAASVSDEISNLKGLLFQDLEYLSKDSTKDLPNSTTLDTIKQAWIDFGIEGQSALTLIQASFTKLESVLKSSEAFWVTSKSKIEQALQEAVSTIPGFAGKAGADIGKQYLRIVADIESTKPASARLGSQNKVVADLETERRELLSEWSRIHQQQFTKISSASKAINDGRLKGKIKISVQSTGDRTELKEFLSKLAGIGPKKIEWIDKVDILLIQPFVQSLREGKEALLAIYGTDGLSPGTAEQIAKISDEQIYRLQEIELKDKITIGLNVAQAGNEQYKPLDNLSTGQKCTAILHLLLLENEDPLIVDQPEDHLDNAFIADRIVHEMRDQKCRRQFVFSTHNPNIPVFGDAEWIGALESGTNQAILPDERVGSIDKETVQDVVKIILEGGKAAFQTRRLKYGF